MKINGINYAWIYCLFFGKMREYTVFSKKTTYEGKAIKTLKRLQRSMEEAHQERSWQSMSEYHSGVNGTIINFIKLANFDAMSLLRFICLSADNCQFCQYPV